MESVNGRAKRRGEEFAERAAREAREGGRGLDRAAHLLLTHWAGRLKSYAVYYGRVPEPEAEELAIDGIMKFITDPPAPGCASDVWLMTIMRNVIIDWARRQTAEMRGGQGPGGRIEVSLDEDAMLALIDTSFGHTDLPSWVRECVHKAAVLMQREQPRHAEVLMMVMEGWAAEEIAVFYGARPGAVSDKQKTAARDRAYRARNEAQGYFEHCRE